MHSHAHKFVRVRSRLPAVVLLNLKKIKKALLKLM